MKKVFWWRKALHFISQVYYVAVLWGQLVNHDSQKLIKHRITVAFIVILFFSLLKNTHSVLWDFVFTSVIAHILWSYLLKRLLNMVVLLKFWIVYCRTNLLCILHNLKLKVIMNKSWWQTSVSWHCSTRH